MDHNKTIFHYFHTLIHFKVAHLNMEKTRFMDKPWVLKTVAIAGLLLFNLMNTGHVQAQIPWQEDFGFDFSFTCANQGTLANGFTLFNGPWTVTPVGENGTASNEWFVNAAESGQGPGGCGNGCAINPGEFNQTLHLSNTTIDPINDGANYVEFGPFPFPPLSVTNKRAESPTIDCTGEFTMALTFNYLTLGSATDRCVVEYFDGTIWTQIAILTNPVNFCGPDQTWAASPTYTLPVSANNNPLVKIGFRWSNNNDGNVTEASVAIDDILILAGPAPEVPVVNFNLAAGSSDTFCESNGQPGSGCVTFNDLTTFNVDFSVGSAGSTYAWSFPGGTPATSPDQNPTVCYSNPGFYGVTLTVTDNIGTSAPFTLTNLIEVLDCGPVIQISASQNVVCSNEECIDFTDLSTGNNIFQWTWTFTSASGNDVVTSFNQNPVGICLNEIGFYDVTLSATDVDGTETQTFPNYIQVTDCTGPEVFFEASRVVICPGACIDLTDLSISPTTIFAWDWDLPGGQAVGETEPGSSTQQNPTVCYDTPGTYQITLVATDQEGPSAIPYTLTITVDPCTGPPTVGIGASATEICTGDCVDFFDQSLGLVNEYLWVFQGTASIDDAVSTDRDPSVICYNTAGTYNVTLTASNINGQIDSQTFVDFITVVQCINPPVPRFEVSTDTVCAGGCVQFSNVSTGFGIDSIAWNFQGAEIQTSNEENPEVCYNAPGTYSVSLYANGAGGDSVRVFENVITVINTPECRPTIEAMLPDTMCAGTCEFFSAIFTNADSVHWNFPGGNPETSIAQTPGLVCFDAIGNYTVIIEAFNASGAATPVIANIFVGERPPLNAGPDRTINSGATLTLTAGLGGAPPVGDFLWQPFDLVDNFRNQIVQTSPDETTTYIVYYSEDSTCTAVDSITVFVNFVAAVGVPSAFSPNGDGLNDELRILGQGISRMDFKIFNRYGQLVFETKNQAIGWDGSQNGKMLNPGTFVYTLTVTFAEGATENYTGDTNLIR